jgi:hypothetical protein
MLIASITIYAQPVTDITVSGQVTDSLSKESVSFATVKIFSEQQRSMPVKVGLSDDNGNFRIELNAAGAYILTVEYLGKNTVNKSFSVETGQNLDLGNIEMTDNIHQLQEVTISAQRALVRVDLDKITYNMEEDPESRTNSILEMLKKVPMVTVDGEENIQVRGSSNFRFYINGKPSNMLSNNPKDVLRSIPANTVKNVEVITEPGARYDAEGVAGIINIVMQSQSALGGYTVSLSANASSLGQAGGGTYFSIKYGKVGLTGNLNGANLVGRESTYWSSRENLNNDANRFLTQSGLNKNKGNMLMGFGEFSYEIDTLNLINVNISNRGNNFSNDRFMDVQMKNLNKENVFHYEQTTDSESSYSGTTLGADYQRVFSVKDRLFTASYKLDTYGNEYNALTQINPVLDFNASRNRQFNNADSHEHTFQLDYTTPFAKIHTLETGVRFIKRINKSHSGTSVFVANDDWIDRISDNDRFQHTQDIWAAYAGHNLRYSKWGVKTGIRFESTQLDVDYPLNTAHNFQAGYSNFIPSVTVTYMAKPNQTIRTGYNLRIQRPGIFHLNPYINTTDSNYISFGNPELKVVKYHNFNANYNLFTPKFTMNANLSYSFTNDGISNFTWIDDYVSKTSYFNLLKERRWNFSSYVNWTPIRLLRIFGNLGGTYSNLQSARNSALRNSGFAGNFFGGVQFNLPKDYVLNLNGYSFTPNVLLQGTTMSYYYYGFSASKSLLNRRLTIRAGITNPFTKNLKFEQNSGSDDFTLRTVSTQPFRQFNVSVSYRFGEMRAQIRRAERTIRNEDQMQGESSGASGGSASQPAP